MLHCLGGGGLHPSLGLCCQSVLPSPPTTLLTMALLVVTYSLRLCSRPGSRFWGVSLISCSPMCLGRGLMLFGSLGVLAQKVVLMWVTEPTWCSAFLWFVFTSCEEVAVVSSFLPNTPRCNLCIQHLKGALTSPWQQSVGAVLTRTLHKILR